MDFVSEMEKNGQNNESFGSIENDWNSKIV